MSVNSRTINLSRAVLEGRRSVLEGRRQNFLAYAELPDFLAKIASFPEVTGIKLC